MKTLLLLAIGITYAVAQAQEKKELKVSISFLDQSKERTLVANVKGGSGDYYFSWGSSAMYGINTDKSLSQVVIPLDDEDISYDVYVRDRKTGAIGWRSINFSKKQSTSKVLTYPNPSQDYINLKIDQSSVGVLDNKQHIVKVELFNEKDSRMVKSVSAKDDAQSEVSINVKDLSAGIYYAHLTLTDNVHPEPIVQVVRVLVGVNPK